MDQSVSKFQTVSACFLVAGTCIGGGMLALPVATGLNGFLPSLCVMGICWLSMTLSALLLLEVSLWMEPGSHIITMTSRILGRAGKIISWILYLFIAYASLVAYTAGGGEQVMHAGSLSKPLACFIFSVVFGMIIYLGHKVVGRVNSILFTAMIVAYFALVGLGIDEVNIHNLRHSHWRGFWISIPILLTAFSFQTMVPSLTPILKRNTKALKIAVIGGTGIAFIIYAMWQWIVLGIVPVEGAGGLREALDRGVPATKFIAQHVNGYWIGYIAEYFAFFAIVTSFLGIALGLFDFLADGLHIRKKKGGGILLGILVIIPTWFFAAYFERAFLIALDITGGYGDTILNGMFPVLMVWIGRYWMKYENGMRVPGGKILLIVVFIFFIFSFCVEILGHFGIIPSLYEAYDILEIHNEQEILNGVSDSNQSFSQSF